MEYNVVWNEGSLGLTLRPELGKDMPPVVGRLTREESEAAHGGVAVGHMLTSINGEETAKMGYDAVVHMLKTVPRPCLLRFRVPKSLATSRSTGSSSSAPSEVVPNQQPDNAMLVSSSSGRPKRDTYVVEWIYGPLGLIFRHADLDHDIPSIRKITGKGLGSHGIKHARVDDILVEINGTTTKTLGFNRSISMLKSMEKPALLKFQRSSREKEIVRVSMREPRIKYEPAAVATPTSLGVAAEYDIVWYDGDLGLKLRPTANDVPMISRLTGKGSAVGVDNSRVGDVLVAINGKFIHESSYMSTLRWIKDTRKPITLRFRSRDRDKDAATSASSMLFQKHDQIPDFVLAALRVGEYDQVEAYARRAMAASGCAKSAFAWMGDALHRCEEYDLALAVFDKGLQLHSKDVDCAVGKVDVRETIQLAKVFGPNAAVKLAKDPEMLKLLKDEQSRRIIQDVLIHPSQYHQHKTLCEPVLAYLQQFCDETSGAAQDHTILALPVKGTLDELTAYLMTPGNPRKHRLSDTYNVVADLLTKCNHSVFKAESGGKKSKKLVVKLTDKQREVEFYERMGHDNDSELYIVDCVQIIDVPLAGKAKCFAVVMEQGLALDLDHVHMLQQQPFLRLNCIEKLARAVLFLHGQRLIHGDIKLENVVYFSDRIWYKLIDFDHTVPFGSRIRHCTPEYCPPEMARCMLQGQASTIAASPKFDVWCFGVLVLRLFLDGGHLDEFDGVEGDAVYKLVAAPGFSFRQSLAKVAALNNRQKKYLLMCLEPDESKRTGNLRDLLKALETKSTTHGMAPAPPSPIDQLSCPLPLLWTLSVMTDKARIPLGDFLRGLDCRIGVLNAPTAECTCDESDIVTVLAESDVVALVLPFVRAYGLFSGILDTLEDYYGTDVAHFRFAYPDADKLDATVASLESIHPMTAMLPCEGTLRTLHARLTQTKVPRDEVDEILDTVLAQGMSAFVSSNDTSARVAEIFKSMASLNALSKPTLIGGWRSLSGTNDVTWKCHRHAPHHSTCEPRNLAMTEFAVPEPWELPMLWSLDAAEKLGKCDPSKLERMRFQLVFQCEWCASSCGRFEPQNDADARNDASLREVGASVAIREMLPILNASYLARKALCVAALLGVSLDGFQFDLKDTQHVAKIARALESIHGRPPRFDTDAAFEEIVHRLETEDLDDVELADEARKLQDALLVYRSMALPKMKQVLARMGFDWNRAHVGGLRQVQFASGYSRWVCQVHSGAP
ncbi:serine/threonine protein kinase [Aphanomyces invadans]|uniref:Serine/threonine protein kinase n=1 Tax=Aphanomyces invadans TaxID=157072 RepID=A0A024TBH2_9STRA|nr:serine/threonine protein kinase [Aphanomyces invadans]ETV90926.1 serine/threonine protein kinase [Aphanomyces invadans]|eukprot:XP_008880491.1 serine/threonine protein kinase [Aphanomyces invadans]